MKLTFVSPLNVEECRARLMETAVGDPDPADPRPRVKVGGLFGSQDLALISMDETRFRLGFSRAIRYRPMFGAFLHLYYLDGRFLESDQGTQIELVSWPQFRWLVLGVVLLGFIVWKRVRQDLEIGGFAKDLWLMIVSCAMLYVLVEVFEIKRREARSLIASFQEVFQAVLAKH